ncbi:MAG: hypothetical protein IJ412_03780 [Oscillospiraceae bacterium]|nr:hypothetical protein [Oscillospiraceae bacterium]
MYNEKYYFASAFTPDGWIESMQNNSYTSLLLSSPPHLSSAQIWPALFPNMQASSAIYIDPFSPGRSEGFLSETGPVLLSNMLHPRFLASAPFFTTVIDLHQLVFPFEDATRYKGILLLKKQMKSLREAQLQLRAAKDLLAENIRIGSAHLLTDKIYFSVEKIASGLLAAPSGHNTGRIKNETRFYSSITPNGIVFCEKALHCNIRTVVALSDTTGAAARLFLRLLTEYARKNAIPHYIGRCSLFYQDKTDHLIFPQQNLLVTTSNRFHTCRFANYSFCCGKEWMRPMKKTETTMLHRNTVLAYQKINDARLALRQTSRIQAALEELCPVRKLTHIFPANALADITAKNTVEI